ncbi:MAG TPA: penicillin-binding transpeptidase domain-containing protein [Chitinophagaceae bacterium]|nr:penicillin-binding transpeptidase domain-containing protein [Chitinophagaceae bacterium]
MKNALISISLLLGLYACSPNNVKQDDSLGKYFTENKVDGCFAIMDNASGKFTVFNLGRYRDSSYLPASTFKIVNSLIGLQTGKIVNDSMIIKWDSVKRWKEDWNKDLTMYEAFRVSSVPYYQEVARRIGRDTMQLWLDSIKYGAQYDTQKVVIRGAVDSFWLNNTLKVTPDQQLGLVKKLYFDQLPFFKSYQEMVKRAMLFENNTNYRLGYKTGLGYLENGNILGWVVGWVEENGHPYFFVLNAESPNRDIEMTKIRLKIVKDILKEMGFFEGKM